MLREIVLDTETTGLDARGGDRVIEIGLVELVDKVVTGRRWQTYVNPMRLVSDGAMRVHGITSEFLRDKPKFHEVADDFLSFVEDSRLIIHNAPFDMGFLDMEFNLLKIPSIDRVRVIDTLPMAKKMFPGMKNNLDALCKRYKIDNSDRTFHGALKDARLLAGVYVSMTQKKQTTLTVSTDDNTNITDEMRNTSPITIHVIRPSDNELETHQKFNAKLKA